MSDDITISTATAADWKAIGPLLATAFNSDSDEESDRIQHLIYEPQRTLLARSGERVIGTAGIFTRRLQVPGALVPAAHVTRVAVDHTARRQGILRRLMTRQLADVRAAREPIAVLWASEGRIYPRFGYGLAVRRLRLRADTSELRLTTPVTGRLRTGTPAELRGELVAVYEAAWSQHPGWSERSTAQWEYYLADPKTDRHGATALRATVHEGERGVDGYALWRTAADWDEAGPSGEVRVIEQVAATPEAYAALWQLLLTVDLTRTTSVWCAAVDEPLQYLVNEPRRLGARLADALWLRLIDLPAALAARRYARDVDLVIEVGDEQIPANAGRWRLTASPDRARCVATPDEPELSCDVPALASAYLGGTSLDALATAGLVREHRPGALAEAATAFGWHRAPSVLEVF